MRWSLVFVIMFSGCGSTPSSQSQSAPAKVETSHISLYRENPASQFKRLGLVSATSCTQEGALKGLKTKAAVLKANAIVNFRCFRSSNNIWNTDCKIATQCSGQAITIK